MKGVKAIGFAPFLASDPVMNTVTGVVDLPETIAYYYKTYCDRTSIGLIRFHPVDQKIIVCCNNGTNQTWQNTEIGWKRR